jgi:hypothetical protein
MEAQKQPQLKIELGLFLVGKLYVVGGLFEPSLGDWLEAAGDFGEHFAFQDRGRDRHPNFTIRSVDRDGLQIRMLESGLMRRAEFPCRVPVTAVHRAISLLSADLTNLCHIVPLSAVELSSSGGTAILPQV